MEDDQLPHWHKVLASMEAQDWHNLHLRLEQGLLNTPSNFFANNNRHQATIKIQSLLRQHLGLWHHSGGPTLGDEMLNSWCWCHALYEHFDATQHDQSAMLTAQMLMDELRFVFGWYVMLRDYMQQLGPIDETNREQQLTQIFDALVDHTIAYGLNDSWYQCLAPAIVWILQHQGLTVSDQWGDQIFDSLFNYFSSWVRPTRTQQTNFAKDVAWQALLLEFDAVYHE